MPTDIIPPDFDQQTTKNIKLWLNGAYDEATKMSIKKMIIENPKEAIDSFYTKLSFGTGGLRGIMGPGSNRLNIYTIRQATQGLATYILKHCDQDSFPSVLISYDSRHHSRQFAEESAKVLAANGIKVYLTKEMRPTPLVSFGCRFLKCQAAIMLTASHNPPKYNGYKVYWSDGAQVLPPHDVGIIEEIDKINSLDLIKLTELSNPLITEIGEEMDTAYLNAIAPLALYPNENRQSGSKLKVVYTSLHGTGITMVPKALASWGFNQVSFVEKQIEPDGDFPTAPYPNPEEKAALELGIIELKKTGADILIATDPDADRVGVAVLHQGEVILLSGNQMAAICLEHICQALSDQERLPQNAAFIKTIGTTELFQSICNTYQRPCFNVLTGFKYIGQKIHEWQIDPHGFTFIFGGEESFGYLLGTNCRDKDAISASTLICEIALQAKKSGKTLIDLLHELYREHGIYYETLTSLNFEDSKFGKEQMQTAMDSLRKNPPKFIADVPVQIIEDFKTGQKHNFKTNRNAPLEMPLSDILLYWLENGTKLMIRPSGTEAKIKIYCGVVLKEFIDIPSGEKECEKRAALYTKSLESIFKLS